MFPSVICTIFNGCHIPPLTPSTPPPKTPPFLPVGGFAAGGERGRGPLALLVVLIFP